MVPTPRGNHFCWKAGRYYCKIYSPTLSTNEVRVLGIKGHDACVSMLFC